MKRDAPGYLISVTPRGKKGETFEPIDVSDRVTSFAFEDNETKADKLQITVDNYDLTQTESSNWKGGQVLRVQWGYPGNMTPARTCVIKSVKGGPVLTIEAYAKSVLMDSERKSRLFENMKRSEVVEVIAKENGYTGERVHVEDSEVRFETIQQAKMSDAQFLRHLANREGFEFFVDFDGLHWHERRLGQTPVRELVWFGGEHGDLRSWNIENDITRKPSRVVAKGRDPIKKKDVEGVGSDQTTPGKDMLGDFLEVIDKQTGESTGTSAINTATDEVQPTSQTSDKSAARVAAGRFKKGLASTIKLRLGVVGDPNLLAKSVILVSGLGDRLSGRYYITSVKTKIGGGYGMSIECRRNGSSKSSGLRGDRGVPATGAKNKQPVKVTDQPEAVEVVDPTDGTSKVVFRDGRGRSSLK